MINKIRKNQIILKMICLFSLVGLKSSIFLILKKIQKISTDLFFIFGLFVSIFCTQCAGRFDLGPKTSQNALRDSTITYTSIVSALPLSTCTDLQQKIIIENGVSIGLTFLAGGAGLTTLGSLPIDPSNTGLKNGLIIGGGLGALVAGAGSLVLQYVAGQTSNQFLAGGCTQ
jgi:hypothetical protein